MDKAPAMAFNSQTYHRNRARKSALAYLEEARDVKRRAAAGDAYDWEVERLPRMVALARNGGRIYLSYLAVDRMNADHRNMSAVDFIAKYGKGA